MWFEGGPETRASASLKVLLTIGLIVLTQIAVFKHAPGWGVGAFCLAWAAAAAVTMPAIFRHHGAVVAFASAVLLSLFELDRVSFIGLVCFWIALTTAALLPLTTVFEDAFRWAQRLFLHGLASLVGPLIDLWVVNRALPPGSVGKAVGKTPMIILPLVGGAVFLTLFATANPVLADFLAKIRWPTIDVEFIGRTIFAGFVLVLSWGALRPRAAPVFLSVISGAPVKLSAATLVLSLIVFNALFALQNGLDAVFLWSGAKLPQGLTFAEYAHRGAYTLIFTALLAGAFVLVALHPQAPAAKSGAVRALVVLWTLQNLMLVASSALRTADYVEAYGLTPLRLAALVWMALVAVGLALICWRLIRGRSGGWLINANAAAAALVLIVSSGVDYGAVSAWWNVRHPQQPSGKIDLCYLRDEGVRALVPLVEMEQTQLDPVTRETVQTIRADLVQRMWMLRADPYSFTPRDARRLAKAKAVNGGRPFAEPAVRRNCDLTPIVPKPTAESYQDQSHAFRR